MKSSRMGNVVIILIVLIFVANYAAAQIIDGDYYPLCLQHCIEACFDQGNCSDKCTNYCEPYRKQITPVKAN